MNKFFLTVALAIASVSYAFGQQVVNMTSDMVLTEPLVITESTTYEGNGHKITCPSCEDGLIKVEGDIEVHFNNVMFGRVQGRWMTNSGGAVYWNSPRTRGHIIWGAANN